MQIKDITNFVQEQHQFVQRGALGDLTVAEERVFHVEDAETRDRISVDKWSKFLHTTVIAEEAFCLHETRYITT